MTGPNEIEEGGEDNRTRVYTDSWGGYNPLNDNGFNHNFVNHALGWGFGDWTTNHIEGFWSYIKSICNT